MLVFPTQLLTLSSALPVALACLGYEGGVPVATTTRTNSSPMTVKSGEVFDCRWARYDRGSGACGSGEGGGADAVFLLQAGGTLRNCIPASGAPHHELCVNECEPKSLCNHPIQFSTSASAQLRGMHRIGTCIFPFSGENFSLKSLSSHFFVNAKKMLVAVKIKACVSLA